MKKLKDGKFELKIGDRFSVEERFSLCDDSRIVGFENGKIKLADCTYFEYPFKADVYYINGVEFFAENIYVPNQASNYPPIDVTQQLRLLDDYLSSTIHVVQDILCELPYMGGDLGFAADATYQKNVSELYNMVKGWVGE